MKKGCVYLCGAGCGEADLITVRGMNVLKRCDVVIYDSLIDESLLEYAPAYAERICAGKRAGRHSAKQEDINSVIAEKALEGKCVVRLKGGDPLVFGRGGEEAEFLGKNGIFYEFIPGITSSVAAPEFAGIPVTHRNLSRSFHVVTGHTADDTLPENMTEYARLNGTLVFLMGLNSLPEIACGLMKNGKSPDTPAAVISNGGSKNQTVIKGVLSDISEKAKSAETPAVIVVGETALCNFICEKKMTVSVVGTRTFTEKLAEKTSPFGIKNEFPCRLFIKEYTENAKLDNALKNISRYSVITFTSANAVKVFFGEIKRLCIDARKFARLKFAVIGSGTAAALAEHGFYADIIPEKYTCAELGKTLADKCGSDDNILIPRAEHGSDELTKPLGAAGINYSEIKIYDVRAAENTVPYEIGSDFLVFGSGTGVKSFFDCGFTVSDNTDIICIGENTADKLKKICGRKCILPDTQSTDGIAEIILGRNEI